MESVVQVCDEFNLAKSEVLLELDFLPDKDGGSPPALRSPVPDFKVKASRGYFEGERPNEPDWFYKHDDEETYNKNMKSIIPGLKDYFNRVTEIHLNLLCFVRHSGELTSCYRMQMEHGSGSGVQLFGEEEFQAFRSAIQDENFEPLHNLLVERVATRDRRYLAHISSEDEIDRVRAILNRMGGDF
jgi:hypothetical protein